MNNEELSQTIEKLLPYFSKIYYFNKLHRLREYPVVKPIGSEKNFQIGEKVFLGAEEFSLLWLLETLVDSSYKKNTTIKIMVEGILEIQHVDCCERNFLEQIFLWRKSANEKTLKKYKNKFNRIMKRLRATGIIDYEDDENNTKKHVIYLTEDGEKCLVDLRKERVLQLKGIFELSTIQPHEFNRLLTEFENLSNKTWEIIFKEIVPN